MIWLPNDDDNSQGKESVDPEELPMDLRSLISGQIFFIMNYGIARDVQMMDLLSSVVGCCTAVMGKIQAEESPEVIMNSLARIAHGDLDGLTIE